MDNADVTDLDDYDERLRATTVIQHKTNELPNLLQDDWIAVAYPRGWFPGQFIRNDEESEEVYVNILEKTSSNANTFTWPALNMKEEDKCWIDEGDYYHLIC